MFGVDSATQSLLSGLVAAIKDLCSSLNAQTVALDDNTKSINAMVNLWNERENKWRYLMNEFEKENEETEEEKRTRLDAANSSMHPLKGEADHNNTEYRQGRT